ncbi:hypothetical protein B0T18DRAFT_410675 [Schizothecium vesticola]|uniref:Uncharacterized protein n=1 Tax=Schizothecium vesticola TaxID=314040 RepID=A0AA40EUZ5_9PEZI|nr:hypothetical protein B0T18DRAFT_410675 [Schizothecium vesticola]
MGLSAFYFLGSLGLGWEVFFSDEHLHIHTCPLRSGLYVSFMYTAFLYSGFRDGFWVYSLQLGLVVPGFISWVLFSFILGRPG